ncbi:MAG: phosphatase PAP2 family protein [Atopobiaceae bacterium]|nr:phosphatase PAP2 family protein [Atopobiaceae bacterium]
MDIEYLSRLQELRELLPQIVSDFFMLVSNIAYGPVLVLLGCAVYWCINKRTGCLTLFSYVLSSFVTNIVKITACQLRPWMRDEGIIPYGDAKETATGFSFPSGHTQGAASVVGSLAWSCRDKNRWVLPCGALFILLVGFSRNFLGVHTPQDVFFGLVIGLALIPIADYMLKWVDGGEDRDRLLMICGIVLSLLFVVYIHFKPYPSLPDAVDEAELVLDSYQVAGVMLGAFIGWFCERRYICFESNCALREAALRIAIGAAVVVLFRYGLTLPFKSILLPKTLNFIKGGLTALAAVAVAPWAFTKILNTFQKSTPQE